MKNHRTPPPEILRACARHGVVPTRYLLSVNIAEQTTSLYERGGAPLARACFKSEEPAEAGTPNGAASAAFVARHRGDAFGVHALACAFLPLLQEPLTNGPSHARGGRQVYKHLKTFRCSTSKFGIGEVVNSNKTPRGLHRVAEKFGGGWPVGTVFEGRRMVGYAWNGRPFAPIASRLLWLDGLEPGFNRGGDVDSYRRYIYIHGVGNETTLGRPDSHGCVHLAADDLIPLYDKVPVDTLVWIAEG